MVTIEAGVWIPFATISTFWGIIGIVCPFFAKGPNTGVIRTCLILTACCAWLFWVVTFLAQLNPLEGPSIKKAAHLMLACNWGNKIDPNCNDPIKK
ncbi:V-type proton ATPase subunit e 2-like [Chrysoperla carnea]|uniref:V-type proton ATPase subunit e 2-like n=1 Tax=Chrysoperla carnea TaxID=189513 RepID=UPI001D06DB6B|nr:V-type proton ATPase subunit e 2-like [Chrysoperla carnea]